MADHLTVAERSRAMQKVRLKNGPLEAVIQTELRLRGLRFKRHVRTLPGRPDIVFERQKIVVFVDGDFWHGWHLPKWEHKLSSFWREKLRANRVRDARNFRLLRARGWRVIRLWQHEIIRELDRCIERIESAVECEIT
jgi:DNA mismatch endonuclease, patch repair protein